MIPFVAHGYLLLLVDPVIMDSLSLLKESDHPKNGASASCCKIQDGAGRRAAAFEGATKLDPMIPRH